MPPLKNQLICLLFSLFLVSCNDSTSPSIVASDDVLLLDDKIISIKTIFDNDTVNGVAINPEDVSAVINDPSDIDGVTLNIDGTATVSPDAEASTYSFDYTICEKINPFNCSTASVTVTKHLERTCIPRFYSSIRTKPYNADAYIANRTSINLDEDKVVTVDYGKAHNNAGIQYTPITAMIYANKAYGDYCSSQDNRYKQIVITHADWLVESVSQKRTYASWDYNFPFLTYDIDSGWTSALGNAAAIVVLTQAYSLIPNPIYLDTIRSALTGFELDLTEQGLAHRAKFGGVWYEEYPDIGNPSTVLNGHMIALFGLEYFKSNINDQQSADRLESLIQRGTEAIIKHAHLFDNNAKKSMYYSLRAAKTDHYSLPYAYWGYIHVYGLQWIANNTGNLKMMELGRKWQSYIENYQSYQQQKKIN